MPRILRGSVIIDDSSRATKEASGFRISLVDRDLPTPPSQFVCNRQARDPSTEDRDFFWRMGQERISSLVKELRG